MNDFEAVTPAMHFADQWQKGGDSLSLQVCDNRLLVLGTSMDGIPLRAWAAEQPVLNWNNWFTRSGLYSHTNIL